MNKLEYAMYLTFMEEKITVNGKTMNLLTESDLQAKTDQGK